MIYLLNFGFDLLTYFFFGGSFPFSNTVGDFNPLVILDQASSYLSKSRFKLGGGGKFDCSLTFPDWGGGNGEAEAHEH